MGRELEQLRTAWDERGIDETLLAVDADGTVVQGTPAAAQTSWSAVVDDLPDVAAQTKRLIGIGAELGRGAMGTVTEGTQPSLGRGVAVKAPLEDVGSAATQALLREAWICGQLEHPNVIPVYALYRQDGLPLLIMRRVEGSDWSAALRQRPALDAQLRVLTQVCHAVHYAHTRGILHLDLKPSNVMIGSYGEIYLLDWGIAVCTRDDFPSFLPRARDITGVLGTPAYMAPELAIGDGAAIGVHTDVYLLGAVLHELLTGRAPHDGADLVTTLGAAFASAPPAWPPDAPTELAAIASKAMARGRADRHASVAAFREALEDYLLHADSIHLATAAQDRCTQLFASLRNGDADSGTDALAAEAEFGFRQALHVWPDNAPARVALQHLLEQLIERDLRRGGWQLAQRRLSELPEPRADLAQRAAALRDESDRAATELERLRGDADLGLAGAQRASMAYVGAFLWALALIGYGQLDHWGVVVGTHAHMLGITVGGTLILAALALRYRDKVFANAISRNAVALLAVGFVMADLFWVGAWLWNPSFEQAVVGVTPITGFVIAGHAASIDRRLIPHAIVAIIGNISIIACPSWGLEIMGVAGAIVLIMLGRTWGR